MSNRKNNALLQWQLWKHKTFTFHSCGHEFKSAICSPGTASDSWPYYSQMCINSTNRVLTTSMTQVERCMNTANFLVIFSIAFCQDPECLLYIFLSTSFLSHVTLKVFFFPATALLIILSALHVNLKICSYLSVELNICLLAREVLCVISLTAAVVLTVSCAFFKRDILEFCIVNRLIHNKPKLFSNVHCQRDITWLLKGITMATLVV